MQFENEISNKIPEIDWGAGVCLCGHVDVVTLAFSLIAI